MSSHKLGWLFALGIAAALVAASSPQAAVFNVDTLIDDPSLTNCDDATPNDCSLRGAIIKANGLAEASTINIPAGTYVLTPSPVGAPCQYPFAGAPTPTLCLSRSIWLVGEGADTTIIDANQPTGPIGVGAPVLFVAIGATVRVSGLTLKRGNFSAGFSGGIGGELGGGGIDNGGTLTLEDCVVSDSYTAGYGGGIYNHGDLTLLRSVVTRNTSQAGGGGIINTARPGCSTTPCPDSGGLLTIGDSTVSANLSVGVGGGILNDIGAIDIAGSTISGNVAGPYSNGGGGIWNSSFNAIGLTNVTVSGNRAPSGGGIFNQGSSTLYLNNVTIANNVARWDTDPTRGIGGGLVNQQAGVVTLQNTLIAGNVAAQTNGVVPYGPDCLSNGGTSAALTSQGYNLIKDTSLCDIVGDTTGNVIGQDPGLGVLSDNGGSTFTHALAAGSVAIDAGNPASPGSSGTACAAFDQRGFLRPLGAACDIGAFERGGAFSITRTLPNAGGNTGSVTVLVSGDGFTDGSTVKLTRAGQADIVGNPVQVDVGGSVISASFDLTGRFAGPWDVVVVKPDSTSKTLPAGFTVEESGGPDVWVSVVGWVIPRHGASRLTIFYGNRGNVDALAVPLSLSLSSSYGLGTFFDIALPPSQPDQSQKDFSQVLPVIVQADASQSYINVPLLLSVVPAGFTGSLQILVVLPPVPTPGSTLFVSLGSPYFGPTLDPQVVDSLVAGAVAYAQVAFDVAISAALVPSLEQYVQNQLQLVVSNGRARFAATLGSSPLIYSVPQLEFDAAIVGAFQALH